MTKNAATETKLGKLHDKVADVMLNALETYDEVNEKAQASADEETPFIPLEPSAALLGAITKFLKDNEITCNTDESQKLSGLAARMASKERVTQRQPGQVVPLRDLPVTEEDAQRYGPVDTSAVDTETLKKLGLA